MSGKIRADDHMIVFFNDTATTEIYPLPLHDALPISRPSAGAADRGAALGRSRSAGASRRSARRAAAPRIRPARPSGSADRKSTRLNSSHANISYAVFCLKKKKKNMIGTI